MFISEILTMLMKRGDNNKISLEEHIIYFKIGGKNTTNNILFFKYDFIILIIFTPRI